MLHQFPIGHMPVAASQPSAQLPPPPPDQDRPGGLRFPPQDHPNAAAVDGADALERVRNGEAHSAVARARALPAADHARLPAELRADHEPLGGLNELDWAARYVVRVGSRDEHTWPPGEGGAEARSVVLPPDTVLDCLGTGEGRIAAAEGTPFAQRSLPAEHLERDHRRYRVLRPLPAWRSVSGPWFGQPGGGARFRTSYPLADLVALGHLVELSRGRQLAEAGTVRLGAGASAPEQPSGGRPERAGVAGSGKPETARRDPEHPSPALPGTEGLDAENSGAAPAGTAWPGPEPHPASGQLKARPRAAESPGAEQLSAEQIGSGQAGSVRAGSGQVNSGQAGSGQAGSGQPELGRSGQSGSERSGRAPSRAGQSGPGQPGAGQTGPGQAGSGRGSGSSSAGRSWS